MPPDIFRTLILIARPAAGKSEIIHHLKNTPDEQRRGAFHVGEIVEIDDFPMLWAWFEEDALLAEMGKPRLHTDDDGYFKWQYLWDLLIRRISLDHQKRLAEQEKGGGSKTALVEFARGKEHGGFQQAFLHLSKPLLEQAAILYIDVTFEESLRKNRRRYNPQRAYSILEHGLSDEKMHRLYADSDWQEVSGGVQEGYLEIQGVRVPFVVFDNHDDVTTPGGEPLNQRLRERLGKLWELHKPTS